ncbi:unnamed protein product [Peniophora sp. CBMAI 1063]|nr:unnamed protein product [Peniophora sp. CBMAI 1063]
MNHPTKSSFAGQWKGGSLRAAASRPSSTVSSPAPTSRPGISQTRYVMFGTFVVALALSVAHHFFLTILDGKHVDKSGLTQTWVRDIGNALAGMTGFLLQASVGVALTQSIWLYIRGNRLTLNNLDILFSLPSLSDLPSSLFKSSVLYVLLLAVVIKALSLVSVFAPNALSVIPAHPIRSNLSVPFPSLDRIDGTVSSRLKPVNSTHYRYIGSSPRFQRLARGVLDGNTILPWAPPDGCGRECDYHLNYSGPALRCSDISKSLIDLLPVNSTLSSKLDATLDPDVHVSNASHFLASTYLYNATATFLNGTALPGWSSNSKNWTESDNRSLALDVVYAVNQFGLPANASLNR